MKKVFIVTDFYHSQQNTTGYMLEKVYKSLDAAEDFEVGLITRFQAGIPQFNNTCFVKTSPLNKGNLVKRFFYDADVTLKFSQKIVKLIKSQDIIFTTTTPVFLIVLIAFLKRVIGFKWVLLVHDVFPENLVVANVIKPTDITYKLLTALFNQVYKSADHLIVIGSDMKELIEKKGEGENISIVQNWIDTQDIELQSKAKNKILDKLGWNDTSDVIFQFFGNLGRVQGLDKLLKAIKQVKNLNSAKFLFIGDGTYVNQLQQDINEFNHPNVKYYGKLPPSEKSDGLNACNISFVTLAEGMKGLGVPSKAYYSMAANKYLFAIMEKDTEIVDMISQHDLGWYCIPDDSKVIAEKIDELIEGWASIKHKNPHSRQILESYYSEEIAMSKILNILRDL